MIRLGCEVEKGWFCVYDLEQRVKRVGYVMRGGWEYEGGFFEYKIDDEEG